VINALCNLSEKWKFSLFTHDAHSLFSLYILILRRGKFWSWCGCFFSYSPFELSLETIAALTYVYRWHFFLYFRIKELKKNSLDWSIIIITTILLENNLYHSVFNGTWRWYFGDMLCTYLSDMFTFVVL
jgi:hypothetical protein